MARQLVLGLERDLESTVEPGGPGGPVRLGGPAGTPSTIENAVFVQSSPISLLRS